MKTINGIYLDIKESDYCLKVQGLSFFFTSEFYKRKFAATYEKYIKNETLKFTLKYNIKINLDIYFLITLYDKIEKRGFRVQDENGKEISRKLEFLAIPDFRLMEDK